MTDRYREITKRMCSEDDPWYPDKDHLQKERVFVHLNDRGYGKTEFVLSDEFGDVLFIEVRLFHEKEPIVFYGSSYESIELAFMAAFMKWQEEYLPQ